MIILDLYKSRVRHHFRRLPNGKIVAVKEYFNKKQAAKKEPKKFRHKVVHADEESTTYVNHEGEMKTYPHRSHMELTQDDIHGKLNSAMHIDEGLAFKVWANEQGITDMNKFLDDMVSDEKKRSQETGEDPEFTNRTTAMKYLSKNTLKEVLKDLHGTYGEVTTYARAGTQSEGGRGRLAEYFHDMADAEHANDEDRAIGKMVSQHADTAIKAAEEEIASIKQAQKAKPEDCPKIDSISPDLKFFGHQAHTLAYTDKLKKAIMDVDMGGGKGLLLPADALNFMSKGLVKKPIIVVPGATLEQNAKKILEYTNGEVNVFNISNSRIKEHYEGDMDRLLEDIHNAPPNTIFMASYDVFPYQDKSKKAQQSDDIEMAMDFPRAKALGAAGFDYIACDESHNIKNTQSQRFKAMQYMTHLPYKRCASGTFLSNNPKDVLGQLMFLHPHMAMREAEFLRMYGMEETGGVGGGIKWDKDKLKQLREDLKNMGMISLRRSAWMHLLPKRNEIPRIVKMTPSHEKIHEAILNEVIDDIEEEMKKNPRIKKFFDDDNDFDDDEMPPQVLGPLNLLQSVTDHPDELAKMIEEKLEAVHTKRKELRKKGITGQEAVEAMEEEDPEVALMREQLARMKPEVKKAVLSLKGIVSPKAVDCYKAMDEHFANKKNGKFMVFVQRKASARHIMDNMPEKHKKNAMYFDASQMHKLPEFTQDPNGPKILVAVDASIKEGMNMQIANGQYRYDHHYVPGNQEQGYARIWRFGQDKDANIHLGIVDNGIDVTKYARLISKLHTNMMVISDMEDDDTFLAYKLNLDNIRNNRHASVLDDYFDMNKKILDFQKGENKDLQKLYGNKTYQRSSGKQIGGKKAQPKHGMGTYQSDEKFETESGDVKVTPKEMDSLLGHLRDQHYKAGRPDVIYDDEFTFDFLNHAFKLLLRHKARGGGEKLDPFTMEKYNSDLGGELSDREQKTLEGAINAHLSGKKHTPHTKHDTKPAVDAYLNTFNMKLPASAKKEVHDDAVELSKWMESKKIKPEFDKNGNATPSFAAKLKPFFKGEMPSAKGLKLVASIAGKINEVKGGFAPLKEYFEDWVEEE